MISTGRGRQGEASRPDRPDEDEPFDDDGEEDFLETLRRWLGTQSGPNQPSGGVR